MWLNQWSATWAFDFLWWWTFHSTKTHVYFEEILHEFHIMLEAHDF